MPPDPLIQTGDDSSPASGTGRSQVRIEKHYTRLILSGELASGTQLPPTNTIANEWSVSATVVHKAMKHLASRGLVERLRKSGTVVRNQAERALIGILVGGSLAEETAHFYRALTSGLELLFNRRSLSCRIYDAVNPLSQSPVREYRSLDLLRVDRIYYQFRGFIKIQCGRAKISELEDSSCPIASFSVFARDGDVWPDEGEFAKVTLRELSKRGLHRIAVISARRRHTSHFVPVLDEAAAGVPGCRLQHHGIVSSRKGFHFEEPAFLETLELVAKWKKTGRFPDAILVTDDIVTRGVCMALFKEQIEVPKRMQIATLATEFIHHHYGMPVHRYEFSSFEAAQALEEVLWKRILGEPEPELPRILKGKFRPAF